MENAQLSEKGTRGRPRKSVEVTNSVAQPKRGRGRPRKDSQSGADASDAPISKKPRKSNVAMVAEDGKPFSAGVNQALARLDDYTVSKPLRLCVLGIVRDVIKITRVECGKQGVVVDPSLTIGGTPGSIPVSNVPGTGSMSQELAY